MQSEARSSTRTRAQYRWTSKKDQYVNYIVTILHFEISKHHIMCSWQELVERYGEKTALKIIAKKDLILDCSV